MDGRLLDRAGDRGSEERTSEGEAAEATDHPDRRWPLSSYVVLLALVLYGWVAVAVFLDANSLANAVSVDAVLVLLVGIALRFVEFAIDAPLTDVVGDAVISGLGTVSGVLPDRFGRRWSTGHPTNDRLGHRIGLTIVVAALGAIWWVVNPGPIGGLPAVVIATAVAFVLYVGLSAAR